MFLFAQRRGLPRALEAGASACPPGGPRSWTVQHNYTANGPRVHMMICPPRQTLAIKSGQYTRLESSILGVSLEVQIDASLNLVAIQL